MKKALIAYLICTPLLVQAQLYAPEIKVLSTGGPIGINRETPDINAALDINGAIKLSPATNDPNASFAIGYALADKFLYDGWYLNHYGLGFYSPSSGGLNPYISGFYGIDIFTEGKNRISIKRNGNVGIGLAIPSYKLSVNGAIQASAGYITSDVKLKRDIEDYTFGLTLV